MARWESNNPYVNIDLNVSNIYLLGDWPSISFHFDCDFNYYCPKGYASMSHNGVNFHTQVTDYDTETKTESVSFNLTAGQESSRYGTNFYNPKMGNAKQRTVDVHAWITGGLYTGGGYTTVASPTIGNPSKLTLSVTKVTQNSCVVTHGFTNNRNYWFVRLWDRNTRTYYNLNTNHGNGTTTITGLQANQEYAFELWACGRDGGEYGEEVPKQTIKTLGKSSIGNTPNYTIDESFSIQIQGYSDNFTHKAKFQVGSYEFQRANLKRGNVTITPTVIENKAMYSQMNTIVTKPMDIVLETFMNASSIGTTTSAGSIVINQTTNAPSVQSFIYKDIAEDALLLTENDQFILQNVSRIQVSGIQAQAKNSATIAKYRMEVSNGVFEHTSTTIHSNVITSNTPLTLKAIDSRGLQGTLTKRYPLFITYDKPVIKEFQVLRLNDVDTITKMILSGSYAQVKIADIAKNEIVCVSYRYKKTTDNQWSDFIEIIPEINEDKFTFDNRIGNFDASLSYNFEIQVRDRIRTSTLSAILVVGKPVLSIRKGGIGINKVPESGKAIDVSGIVNSDTGFYKNGNYLQPMSIVNGYWGFLEITDWLRVPNLGILPKSTTTNSHIGADTQPFKYGYFENLYKNNISIPNNDETPIISTGNGWNVYKFPSGMMIQTIAITRTMPIEYTYGALCFGYVPAVANYPIPFIGSYPINSVSLSDNNMVSVALYRRSLTNITDGSPFYVYDIQKRTSYTMTVYLTSIGRWK